jgi:hypothetical protein
MLAEKATLGAVPGTREEREALRRASGDAIGGSSLDDLIRGYKVRYGWDTARWQGTLEGARTRLSSGAGMVWQGLYARLPKHLQRWDTRFAAKGVNSGPAAYADDYRADGTVLWMDPLARSQPGQERWAGERWDWADIARACFGPSYTMVLQEGVFAPAKPPAPEPDPTVEGMDVMFNVGPITTHRDAVLAPGAVIWKDSKMTRRYSRVDKPTRLGFIGSTAAAHVVADGDFVCYVSRAQVSSIEINDRTYS